MASSSNLTVAAPRSRRSSNASQKPPQRPPSAAGRPTSSLSVRPVSRVSQRPSSRLSRPATRQSSRLQPFIQSLVIQLTRVNPEQDVDRLRTLVEQASKGLEFTTKVGAGADITTIDRQIRGHAHKARINSRDELAEALEISYQTLKTEVQQHTDVDQDLKLSTLPAHMQFLMTLSRVPEPSTLAFAEARLETLRNPPEIPPRLTWKDILEGDPYEGQHWEGAYGLPPGSTIENWEMQSNGSTSSLSSLNEPDDLEDTRSLSSSTPSEDFDDHTHALQPSVPTQDVPSSHAHRTEFEELQGTQYWRDEWRSDANIQRRFDIRDASTLGPAFQRALQGSSMILGPALDRQKYINEVDAVREVLIALQGRQSILFTWSDDFLAFLPDSDGPRLLHLTFDSFISITSFFARTATSVEHLRKFTSYIFTQSTQSTQSCRNTRTLEAFADAVDHEIRAFYKWCADREEQICRVTSSGIGLSITVSLLGLEKAVKDSHSKSFDILLDVLQQVANRSTSPQPASWPVWELSRSIAQSAPVNVTSNLLDILTAMVQDQLSVDDELTSEVLMRVFARTAEPVWAMVGSWLKNGMPIRDPSGHGESYGSSSLDDEFFIEDNDMVLVDPDFWKEGYTLRDRLETGSPARAVPVFLAHIAEHILSCGKTVGLLRVLDIPLLHDDSTITSPPPTWPNFAALLAQESSSESESQSYPLLSLSTDRLSQVVHDASWPYCQATGSRFTKALFEDFGALHHLSAIEDLYLMRRGDTMSHFADVLFAKMDVNPSWTDFHFLNTAFGDVVEASSTSWIKPSLVRLSYRGSKDKAVHRTVRALEGLLAEYAVPFPLTFIFGPRILQVYDSIFIFLLQIRRAKTVLERILVRGATAHDGSKAFYAMRGKLSWFVNALLNFMTTYVIHAQVLKFRDAFRAAQSLDEMIHLHDDHLDKIQGRCLLRPNTVALHRAIISILDMCLHFADLFVTFAGDATLDISRQSISIKRHRSRRQRRQRRNVIGFSQSLRSAQEEVGDSSDDDDDDDHDHESENEFGAGEAPEPSSFSVGVSFASSVDEGSSDRLDKMSSELDGLVRFIRRGVESLAGGTGEAAPAFGVLAFALEDWDM